MSDKKRSVTASIAALLVSCAAPTFASDCAQVLEQVGSQAQAFQAEAQRMGIGFARDEFLNPALDAAKKGLEPAGQAWDPAMGSQEEAVTAFQAGKAKLIEWKNKVETWNSQMVDIKRCVNDPHCSLLEMSKQLNRDLREWLASLGSGGTAEAAERVNKAASLLESYSARLEGAAETSIGSALSCMDQSSPQPASSPNPVDLSNAQAGTAAAGAGSASGGAPAAGIAGGAAAGKHGANVGLRVAGGVVAVGGGILAGKLISDAAVTDTASCPSATQMAATAGGGVVAVGDDTICTQFVNCGVKNPTAVRSCASHICDPGSCSIYYEFSGGNRVVCLTGCDAAVNSAQFSSAIMNCATRAVGNCQ